MDIDESDALQEAWNERIEYLKDKYNTDDIFEIEMRENYSNNTKEYIYG